MASLPLATSSPSTSDALNPVIPVPLEGIIMVTGARPASAWRAAPASAHCTH